LYQHGRSFPLLVVAAWSIPSFGLAMAAGIVANSIGRVIADIAASRKDLTMV
jgi:hypothetical protein